MNGQRAAECPKFHIVDKWLMNAAEASTRGQGWTVQQGARLENCLVVTEGEPDIFTPYPVDERLLNDTHPLDRTTGRTRPLARGTAAGK